MGSFVTSCGVIEKAGSCCGWIPAPLMTVRASKKSICGGSLESPANGQAWAWGTEKARWQCRNRCCWLQVWCQGMWSPTVWAEGLAGLSNVMAEGAVLEPFHKSHSVTSHESTINTLKAAGILPGAEQCCQRYPSPSRRGLFTDCSFVVVCE